MIDQFDHRFGTYEGQTQAQANQGTLPPLTAKDHLGPFCLPFPRYWVNSKEVKRRCESTGFTGKFYIAFRDITSAVAFRTTIFAALPPFAVANNAPVVRLDGSAPTDSLCFLACVNSFTFDYIARQNVGGNHLNFYLLKQLPVLPPQVFTAPANWRRDFRLKDWMIQRVLELTYTAWDLEGLAKDCGINTAPFRWDEERRLIIQCELDAAFFHLYGISREDADYILDSFPIVKRKDEARFGEYLCVANC